MTIALTDMVWEFGHTLDDRSAAHADNGGGFQTGASGTDYTYGAGMAANGGPKATYTDLVIGSAGSEDQLSSVIRNFVAADVGNVLNITGGTGFTTGRYGIQSVAAGVATMDRNVGTADSTAGAGRLGGVLDEGTLDDDAFFESLYQGNIIWIRGGASGQTYTLAAAVNAALAGTTTAPIQIKGYATDRTASPPTGTSRPLIASGSYGWQASGNSWEMHHLRGTTTAGNGFRLGSYAQFHNCDLQNTSTTAGRYAAYGNTGTIYVNCKGKGLAGTPIKGYGLRAGSGGRFIGCLVEDCDQGFVFGTYSQALFSIVSDCTRGFNVGSRSYSLMYGCTAYNCTTGIYGTTGVATCAMGNVIDACTTGAAWNTEFIDYWDYNCWDNTTDTSNVTKGPNAVTADPQFTDAVNGDFSLGSASPAKAAGFPGAFQDGLSTGYLDIGAVQRQEPAGGGGAAHIIGA